MSRDRQREQERTAALVKADAAGVVGWVSDDPQNPFITVTLEKTIGQQFMKFETISPHSAIRRLKRIP